MNDESIAIAGWLLADLVLVLALLFLALRPHCRQGRMAFGPAIAIGALAVLAFLDVGPDF